MERNVTSEKMLTENHFHFQLVNYMLFLKEGNENN